MKSELIIINGDVSDKLIKKLELEYKVTYINSIEEVEDESLNLVIIEMDEINKDKVIAILNKNKIRQYPIIIKSRSPIDSKLMYIEGVVDVIEGKYDLEFTLNKIRTYTKLITKAEEGVRLQSERVRYGRIQSVLLSSIVGLVECRDKNTGGHIRRTAKYMEILAKILIEEGVYSEYLTEEYVNHLIVGAPLHDVGKIGIDDATLRKTTKLDVNEFEIMKQHVTLGVKTIDRIIDQVGDINFFIVAKQMAENHHENWDGTGYPNGLKGDEIPISGRMMALVDVYDAITSVRAYKKAITHEEAVELMSTAMRSKFDPKILEVFIKHNERFKECMKA